MTSQVYCGKEARTMRIAILGLGYVGLTAAGCLLKEGQFILGIEPNEDKIALIKDGRSPIFEPGLNDLLLHGVQEGRLETSQSVDRRLDDCDIAIVCVGTPSAPDGSHNMSYIAEVSRQIASHVNTGRRNPLTVVFRSTFRPGTIDLLVRPIFQSILGEDLPSVEIIYNPEFLRESTAIKDYFDPPKIVIGTKDGARSRNMDKLYENIQAPVFYTGYREAELTKLVDNNFHALKISFANEIGRICSKLGIDVRKVHEIFISDTKLNISPHYLRPGGAFGGSCLPKDVRALNFISEEAGADTFVIESLMRSNEAHKRFLIEQVTKDLVPGARVLLIGLAFKANNDDLRESPNLDLARGLLQQGFRLSIYDPFVDPASMMGNNLGYTYAHLPTIGELLVSREEAEATAFDLAINANGAMKGLSLRCSAIFDVTNLLSLSGSRVLSDVAA
jgi:GDP-mannose 6-dehydrogenase